MYNHAHHLILQSQIFTKYPCQALVYPLDGISLLRSITPQPIGTSSQVDQLATQNWEQLLRLTIEENMENGKKKGTMLTLLPPHQLMQWGHNHVDQIAADDNWELVLHKKNSCDILTSFPADRDNPISLLLRRGVRSDAQLSCTETRFQKCC